MSEHKKSENKMYIIIASSFFVLFASLFLLSGCVKTFPYRVDPDTLLPADYTPKQCEVTPWDAWLSNSSIRFIRAPTEQEVITMFYGQYAVTLTDLKIINTSEITCEACDVCNKGYKIEAYVKSKDATTLESTGWTVSRLM